MKTILMSLSAAIVIIGLVFSPVAAAPLGSPLAAGDCGDTYTVQVQETLSKIAVTCGMTIDEIMVLNPQITNPNVIYAGETLRLTTNVPVIYRSSLSPSYNPYSKTTYAGNASVVISKLRALGGDDVIVSVSGFPAYAQVDYRVGLQDDDPSLVYDGTIGADGTGSQTITIPADAGIGDYWVVQVITTSVKDTVAVTSHTIYISTISSTTNYTGYARVSLSKTQAAPGETVVVTVAGFPVYAQIDFRVGKSGESYSAVYDGTIGLDGTASQMITIPTSAVAGEYWVVKVLTTSLLNGVTVTSHSIYITS